MKNGLGKRIFIDISQGFLAGAMITIGCCVYLACDVKWVGAILFSVALLSICYLGFSLFTGKVGFILDNANPEGFSQLFLGLLGNSIATTVLGIAIGYALPNLNQTAFDLVLPKLDQALWQTLIRAIFCGILMYIAVAIYKDKKSPLGIVFCIPTFILCGFEHSIADMGYFAIAHHYSATAFGFIWMVILGNSIGALLFPAIKKLCDYKKAPKEVIEKEIEKEENSK